MEEFMEKLVKVEEKTDKMYTFSISEKVNT